MGVFWGGGGRRENPMVISQPAVCVKWTEQPAEWQRGHRAPCFSAFLLHFRHDEPSFASLAAGHGRLLTATTGNTVRSHCLDWTDKSQSLCTVDFNSSLLKLSD